jgi:hypothetical protein
LRRITNLTYNLAAPRPTLRRWPSACAAAGAWLSGRSASSNAVQGIVLRHPHRHRSFAPAMRGQRPALATVLAWLALLSMLLAILPKLGHAVPGSAQLVQAPMDERLPGGGESAPQEEAPAKPRRLASARAAAAPPLVPSATAADGLDALMATLVAAPPQVAPSIDSAPATPLPAAPGLRVQRGQAPPQG